MFPPQLLPAEAAAIMDPDAGDVAADALLQLAEGPAPQVTEALPSVDDAVNPSRPAGSTDAFPSATEWKGNVEHLGKPSDAGREEDCIQWSVRIEARMPSSGRRAGAESVTTAPAGSVAEARGLVISALGYEELLKIIGDKCMRRTTVGECAAEEAFCIQDVDERNDADGSLKRRLAVRKENISKRKEEIALRRTKAAARDAALSKIDAKATNIEAERTGVRTDLLQLCKSLGVPWSVAETASGESCAETAQQKHLLKLSKSLELPLPAVETEPGESSADISQGKHLLELSKALGLPPHSVQSEAGEFCAEAIPQTHFQELSKSLGLPQPAVETKASGSCAETMQQKHLVELSRSLGLPSTVAKKGSLLPEKSTPPAPSGVRFESRAGPISPTAGFTLRDFLSGDGPPATAMPPSHGTVDADHNVRNQPAPDAGTSQGNQRPATAAARLLPFRVEEPGGVPSFGIELEREPPNETEDKRRLRRQRWSNRKSRARKRKLLEMAAAAVARGACEEAQESASNEAEIEVELAQRDEGRTPSAAVTQEVPEARGQRT